MWPSKQEDLSILLSGEEKQEEEKVHGGEDVGAGEEEDLQGAGGMGIEAHDVAGVSESASM